MQAPSFEQVKLGDGRCVATKMMVKTERNNVQQVFILTRNRPLNGVQTRVYFLLKQGVLTGVKQAEPSIKQWETLIF